MCEVEESFFFRLSVVFLDQNFSKIHSGSVHGFSKASVRTGKRQSRAVVL